MTQNTKTSLKKTGISWIGEIPEDWEVRYVKSIFRELSIKNHPNEKLLLASQSQGVIYKEEYGTRTTTALVNLESLKLVEIGNFVISLRSFQGGIECAYRKGIISPAYTVFSEYTNIDKAYFKYLFKDCVFIQMLNTMNSGIRDGQSMSFEDFKYKSLPFPPLNTQTTIATFLDQKIEEISTLISNKKKLIELLKEQKQVIIQTAVTRGINTNIKLKDSRIPWIGEIPDDWRVAKTKQIVSIKITDGPHETPEFYEKGVPFASAEAVFNGKINFESIRGFISKEQDEIYSQKCKPQNKDIFIVKSGSTTGKIGVIEEDIDFNIWSPLALVRVNQNLCDYKFIYYFLTSESFQKQVQTFWSFGTQPNIGMGVIENLYTVLPPLSIQKNIVDYIKQETAQIDTVIEKIEKEITLIEEYKISLIYQAVTGKIHIS